jgi:hypothetical protein
MIFEILYSLKRKKMAIASEIRLQNWLMRRHIGILVCKNSKAYIFLLCVYSDKNEKKVQVAFQSLKKLKIVIVNIYV